jgi:hypothetical protein
LPAYSPNVVSRPSMVVIGICCKSFITDFGFGGPAEAAYSPREGGRPAVGLPQGAACLDAKAYTCEYLPF